MIFLRLIGTGGAAAVEHPGVLDKNDDCLSCHASKAMGKSVHSAMANPSTICHLAQTLADTTTLTLIRPKEQICFACHEKSGELQKHTPVVQGRCVECHDSHSSERRMLLRDASHRPDRNASMFPSHADNGGKVAARP